MIELPYLPPPLPADRPPGAGRFVAAGVILLVVATVFGCFTGIVPVSYAFETRYVRQNNAAASPTVIIPNTSVTYPSHATTTPALPTTPSPGYVPRGTAPATPPTTAYSATVTGYTPRGRQPQVMPVSAVLMSVALYGVFTIASTWLGIAALLKRRYVRPLLIILSTHGIIFGVLLVIGIAIGLVVAVTKINTMNTSIGLSPATSGMVIGFVVAGLAGAVFVLVPPIVLLILMRPDAVRATAEYYDLKPRWTDGLPLRVLGLVLTLAVFAMFELIALGNPMLPLVTHFITGVPAAALILAHAAVIAWAAVRVYRREAFGWSLGFWGMVGPMAFFLASSMLIPTERYFDTIRDQPETIEIMRDHVLAFRAASTGSALVMLAAFVIYMLRVKPLVSLPATAADFS